MNLKQVLCAGVAATMLAAALTGCGSDNNTASTGDDFTNLTTTDQYPLDTDVELTYWVGLNANVAATSQSLNDTPFAGYLEEETGVKVKYQHPPTGQETEKFNLMIAARDLTDIIDRNWSDYPGGVAKALEDDIIISLNEAVEKVSPNYKQFLDEHPDHAKYLKTDNGDIYCYAFVRNLDSARTFMGFMVRKDYLEQAGLEAPETIEEWDTMLRAFKDMGVDIPLNIRVDNDNAKLVSPFTSAYNFVLNFYVDNDVVKFGPYEEAFADYVTQMNTWYNDGLLDKNFTEYKDSKLLDANVINGTIGATYGYGSSNFGKWYTGITGNDPNADFVPVKYPAATKGETPFYGQKENLVTGLGAAITTTCKNKEVAARFLDYGYTEEGRMLYTYGREGVSYEVVDGVPGYTAAVTDTNENGGISQSQALALYTRTAYNGPFYAIRHEDDKSADKANPQCIQDAPSVWSQTDADIHNLPLLSLTTEESTELNNIMQDINVYREEKLFKFISGDEPLSNLDQYFEQLKSLNIERAIEINQAAYDRFINR